MFVCVCVFIVWMHVFTYAWVPICVQVPMHDVCVHIEARGWHWVSSWLLFTLYFEAWSLTNPALSDLTSLASQLAPVIPCLGLLQVGVLENFNPDLSFMQILGIQTLAFMVCSSSHWTISTVPIVNFPHTYSFWGECVCATACICRSRDNLWESVFSFHHMSPRDKSQVVRVGGKCLLIGSI